MEIVELPHEDRRCADVITVEDARLEVTAAALDRRLFGNHIRCFHHLSPQNSRSLFLLYSGFFESHRDKCHITQIRKALRLNYHPTPMRDIAMRKDERIALLLVLTLAAVWAAYGI